MGAFFYGLLTWGVPRARGDGPGSVGEREARRIRVPRARGDGPLAPLLARYCLTCSPRTRGWTGLPDTIKALDVVFPAHAGMDRPEARRTRRRGRVPRARGDGPVFSGHYNGDPLVFPAHAGMDRANSA